jgi:hypothetical protein
MDLSLAILQSLFTLWLVGTVIFFGAMWLTSLKRK